MRNRVTIIGDGGWGTALALLLHENRRDVTVWGPFAENIESIRRERENKLYLPGVSIPDGIRWTDDPEQAVADAEIVVLAVPSKFLRGVLASFAGTIPAEALLVSVVKGLDEKTGHRMTQVADEILGREDCCALSGPSHAEEVARHIPTAVTIAARHTEDAQRLQQIFAAARFRAYTSDDLAGVELGGALKNVIAIAVGISDGMKFGDNTRAALITRGLVEISRLGMKLGARAETFAGLSGMGDLIVTCTSRHSRNRAVGERLGRGESIEDILRETKQAVEGVWNCRAARAMARREGVEVPITEEVYAIVHEGKSPQAAVEALLSRGAKQEAGA